MHPEGHLHWSRGGGCKEGLSEAVAYRQRKVCPTPYCGVNGEAAMVRAQAPREGGLESRARQVHGQRLEEKPTLRAWEKEQKQDMAKG